MRVPCDPASNCSYDNVKAIQAATYNFEFTALNVNISSIVGEYSVQIYDHMDCLGGAILTFDITTNTMSMVYTNKA